MKRLLLTFCVLTGLLKAQTSCGNFDFEAGNLTNWSVSSGTCNYSAGLGTYTMTGCCPTTGSPFAVIKTTPLTDPYIGMLPNSPLGGSKVVKINDEISNMGEIARITYTLPVTSSNSIFQYAIASVINGSGHACYDAPYSNVRVRDMSSNVISYDHFVPFNSPTSTVTCGNHSPDFTGYSSSTGFSFFCWRTYTVNLSAYIGTTVMIDVTSSDCDGWAHVGYCYFDAACSAVTPTFVACSGPAGVEENTSVAEISIWPNPAKDNLNINLNSSIIAELFIYDLVGNVVIHKKDLQNENSISTKNLNQGLYFYNIIQNNKSVKTGKIIKE